MLIIASASQHCFTTSASQPTAIQPIILYNIQTMPNNTPPIKTPCPQGEEIVAVAGTNSLK